MTKVHNEGFVKLVDTLGGDHSIVRAARVSYGEDSKGEKQDRALIDYLIRHNHGTPLEHVVYQFHVKAPKPIAVQWFRHRIGSFNEISGRYVEIEESDFVPEVFRAQDKHNKQGSSGEADLQPILKWIYNNAMHHNRGAYQSLLDMGVAKEQARMVLGFGFYTEFHWQVNLRSLFNFLQLRTDSHAQQEIQDYANAVYKLAQPVAPWAFDSWENHVRDAVTFSRDELDGVLLGDGDWKGFTSLTGSRLREFLEKMKKAERISHEFRYPKLN